MRKISWLVVLGVALLAYALLGNYVALPRYLRFLDRGGTSAAGNSFDMAVLIGATKTIVWMYSFQLGVLCIATAWAIRRGLRVRGFVASMLAWLALWSWPSLPAPGAWFYVVFGSLILVAITWVFLSSKQQGSPRSELSSCPDLLRFRHLGSVRPRQHGAHAPPGRGGCADSPQSAGDPEQQAHDRARAGVVAVAAGVAEERY